MSDESGLSTLSAVDMVRMFASRTISPVEVHDSVQAVIDLSEPAINALWSHDPGESRREAHESEQRWLRGNPRGPIDGVPVTLKENLARKGVPMPGGSAGSVPHIPALDAPVTARVKEAGGVVLGSTVMPDWGMLSSGVSSLHGITRSPWNLAWTSGGSSSGAGAAATAGYGPLHVGTDIGGSIRLPGTWLGLATLKPSYGRVPLDSPYPGRVAGPLTRTVADAALLMQVISQPDNRDWTSLPFEQLDWSSTPRDPAGMRVGVHLDAGCGAPLDPAVARTIADVAATFEKAGAEVEPVDPFLDAELLEALDLFWKVRSWIDYQNLSTEQRLRVLPSIVDWCSGGSEVSGCRLLECQHGIMRMQARTVAATSPYDVVISPAAPVPAFAAEQPMPFMEEGLWMGHIAFTAPYNMSGQPAATLNAGFTDDGRPIGVQISGRRFDDTGVLRTCAWYEQERPPAAAPKWPTITSRRHAMEEK